MADNSHLRSGKWTPEEEAYAHELIVDFSGGIIADIDSDEEISLRGYLAQKLRCHPKRISKKFESTGYGGRQTYKHKHAPSLTSDQLSQRHSLIKELAEKFEQSIKALKPTRQTDKRKRRSTTSAMQCSVPTSHGVQPYSASISGPQAVTSSSFPDSQLTMGLLSVPPLSVSHRVQSYSANIPGPQLFASSFPDSQVAMVLRSSPSGGSASASLAQIIPKSNTPDTNATATSTAEGLYLAHLRQRVMQEEQINAQLYQEVAKRQRRNGSFLSFGLKRNTREDKGEHG